MADSVSVGADGPDAEQVPGRPEGQPGLSDEERHVVDELAEAVISNESGGVTPGPWTLWEDLANPDEDRSFYIREPHPGGYMIAQTIAEDDARFITAANPQAIATLLAALSRLAAAPDREGDEHG